jgi:hypothetical protein
MIKWIRTSRLSKNNSLSLWPSICVGCQRSGFRSGGFFSGLEVRVLGFGLRVSDLKGWFELIGEDLLVLGHPPARSIFASLYILIAMSMFPMYVTWKASVRLPGKGNLNPHGARPVHLIITMIKWIRTSRLSIKNSLSGHPSVQGGCQVSKYPHHYPDPTHAHTHTHTRTHTHTHACTPSEAGSEQEQETVRRCSTRIRLSGS